MSKRMKSAGAIAIVAAMLLTGTAAAAEDMEMKDMEMNDMEMNDMEMNDMEMKDMDMKDMDMMDMSKAYSGVDTMKKKGEEYVQVRQLAANLGYMISWNAKSKTVTLVKEKMTIKLMIGSMKINKDGMDLETMYAPFLSKGRTYVSKAFADQYLLLMMQ